MIKQGVVQEKISDLTSMNHLPPLSTLPQWSRINTLDRGRYPKPFVRDKIHLYPEMSKKEEGEENREVDLLEMDPKQRIQHLERNMMFLKQQHQEVLQSLHAEIEGLKKENKGNSYCVGLKLYTFSSCRNSLDSKRKTNLGDPYIVIMIMKCYQETSCHVDFGHKLCREMCKC